MCRLQEVVKVVADDELAVAWVAAHADDGRRVVFVRYSDQHLLQEHCSLGTASCPVYRALAPAAA